MVFIPIEGIQTLLLEYPRFGLSVAQLKNLGLGFDSRDYFSHPRPRDSGAILFSRIALPNLTHFWFHGTNVLLPACHRLHPVIRL